MDQRAERMVHNSMVEVTCKPDSAQYFLITPKLLPDLEYHERMKVLCVNNGEWLPDEWGLTPHFLTVHTPAGRFQLYSYPRLFCSHWYHSVSFLIFFFALLFVDALCTRCVSMLLMVAIDNQ